MGFGRVRFVALVGWQLLLLGCSEGDSHEGVAPATHQVAIENFAYAPDTLIVQLGDSVIWVNKDIVPHTATSPDSIDSGSIPGGKAWGYETTRMGRFAYVCAFHPTMEGTLIVR